MPRGAIAGFPRSASETTLPRLDGVSVAHGFDASASQWDPGSPFGGSSQATLRPSALSASINAERSMFRSSSTILPSSRRLHSRGQSLALLGGLSFEAEMQNNMQNNRHARIETLRQEDASDGRQVKMAPTPSLAAFRPFKLVADDQDFQQQTEGLASSIDNLKNRHEAFQGTHLDLSFGAKATLGVKPVDEDSFAEAKDSLKERLEAFKFHRKCEGELPPLMLNFMAPVHKQRPDQSIVIKNVSEQTMESWSRKGKTARQRLVSANAQTMREKALKQKHLDTQRREDMLIESLDRKRLQAELARARQRSLGDTVSQLQSEELEGPEGSQHDEASDGVAMVASMSCYDRQLVSKLTVMAEKMRLLKAADHARNVHSVLSMFREDGKYFVRTPAYLARMKLLQRWWRHCSKRLRKIRDDISKRWSQLEKVDLGVHEKPVPDTERLIFIENEMRYRRSMVLPAVAAWLKELDDWNRERTKLSCEAPAQNKRVADDEEAGREPGDEEVNTEADEETAAGFGPHPMFWAWRPIRPSYLPSSHPNFCVEGKTHVCKPDCLGRQGDQEIIEMVRRCRAHPTYGGWREIPLAGAKVAARPSTSPYKGTMSRSPNSGVPGADLLGELDLAPGFDDAEPEGLRQWGVGEQFMPRLDDLLRLRHQR